VTAKWWCRALPERGDEIGLLARALSDMTAALRSRIDAVESFAADVAHEIKNPLASLRSALESSRRSRMMDLRRRAHRNRRARRAPDRPAGDRDFRRQPHRCRTQPHRIRAASTCMPCCAALVKRARADAVPTGTCTL
jgi:signal transduction histidine kinase